MTIRQTQQTSGDIEHLNATAAVGNDHVTTESQANHIIIMNIVLYQISTRQVPLTNMPYNKSINESVTLQT